MRFKPQKFDKQIEKDLSRIKRMVKEVVLESAETGMQFLARLSPVHTGSYVLSHRVGINGMTDSGPTMTGQSTDPNKIPEKVMPTTAQAYRLQAATRVAAKVNLKNMPDYGKIILYNQSPHAMIVETLPDRYIKGNGSPYHPYMRATQKLRNQIPAIVERIQRKYK
jgi:hypothetical protein